MNPPSNPPGNPPGNPTGNPATAPRGNPDMANPTLEHPPLRRPLSHTTALLVAVLLTPVLIALMTRYLPDLAADVLLDRNNSAYPFTIQNLMWLVFGLGVAELAVRYSSGRVEREQLHIGYLPEDESTILQGPELRRVYQHTRHLATASPDGRDGQRRFLPQLIARIILQFQTSRSIDQANTLLNSSLELSLHEIDLRYSMIRYVVWVIPTLGFIGTVVGISLALAYAGHVDVQDPTLLAELTKRLAVAFNTTLLALAMSAVLVLAQHIIQTIEEGVLNEAGQYCLDNLINRLYEG